MTDEPFRALFGHPAIKPMETDGCGSSARRYALRMDGDDGDGGDHSPPVSAFGETSFVKEDTDGRVIGIDRSHDVPVGANLSLGEMFE